MALSEPTLLLACAASRAEGRAIIVMKHVRQNRQRVSSRSTKTRATQLLEGAEIGLDASHTTSSSRRGTGGVFFLDILSHRNRKLPGAGCETFGLPSDAPIRSVRARFASRRKFRVCAHRESELRKRKVGDLLRFCRSPIILLQFSQQMPSRVHLGIFRMFFSLKTLEPKSIPVDIPLKARHPCLGMVRLMLLIGIEIHFDRFLEAVQPSELFSRSCN